MLQSYQFFPIAKYNWSEKIEESVKTILKLGKCIRHYKLLYEFRLPAMKQWTMATTVLYHSSPLFQPEQFVAQRSKNCRQIMLTTKPVCFRLFFLQFCSKTCFVLRTKVLTMSSTKLLKHHHQDQPFVKWKIIEWGCVFVHLGFFFSWKKDVNLVLKSTKKKPTAYNKKKTKTFFNENNNSHVPQAI